MHERTEIHIGVAELSYGTNQEVRPELLEGAINGTASAGSAIEEVVGAVRPSATVHILILGVVVVAGTELEGVVAMHPGQIIENVMVLVVVAIRTESRQTL